MRQGLVIYADSDDEMATALAQVPHELAVAVFSKRHLDPPGRVAFFRQREHRNAVAELAAVRAALPRAEWQHSDEAALYDVQHPPAKGQGLPPVIKATPLDPRPLTVEAVACACGGASAAEACTMLETFRHFHPEHPVFMLTDPEGALILSEFAKAHPMEGVTVQVLSEEEQNRLREKSAQAARPYGDFWPITWVAAKLEALERALVLFQRSVLLCDADLIFTRRLPDLSFDADLVLSEHHGPLADRLPEKSGTFNAGLVMLRHGGVLQKWREFFEAGLGGFYEQGCLQMLAREFVTDTFPGSLNWGDWRRTESLTVSRRTPPILHVHLSPDAQRIPNRAQARKSIEAVAEKALADVRAAAQHPHKIAFLHYVKAGGSSWAVMWGMEASPRGGWQELNSFRWLQRAGDWRPEELALINEGLLPGMRGNRFFVHNHSQRWPEEVVREWHQNGWHFASLYRNVRERLVSLWHWNLQKRLMGGPVAAAESIEDFLKIYLSEPVYSKELALHPANDCVEHWAPATSEGMTELMHRLTGLQVSPQKVNTSLNRGYEAERRAGRISDALAEMIEADERVQAWDEFGKRMGLTAAP